MRLVTRNSQLFNSNNVFFNASKIIEMESKKKINRYNALLYSELNTL